MGGIFHQYYTVALTPAVAALVGMGGALLWRRRSAWWAAATLAAASALTGWWGYELLARSPEFLPWLRGLVLLGGILGGLGIVGGLVAQRVLADTSDDRSGTRVAAGGAILAVAAGLAGPAAYSVQTVATAHTGSIVLAGPDVQSTGSGMPGGGGMPGGAPGAGGQGGQGQMQGGPGRAGQGGQGQSQQGQTQNGPGQAGTLGADSGTGGFRSGGGGGGLLDGATVSSDVKAALLDDADAYTWVAATTGSQDAASYQLATEESVMPIGGFNGSDPSPTLAQFEADVAGNKIHYYIASGSGFGGGSFGGQAGGSQDASEIQEWVEAHYTEKTVDGVTLYDLTQPTS
jgi:hypothetical protein